MAGSKTKDKNLMPWKTNRKQAQVGLAKKQVLMYVPRSQYYDQPVF